MLPTLCLGLLGDFRVIYGEQPVTTIESPRLQSLLAYLVLHRHAPQSRQRLAFLLWPDSTETQARNNLRQALHLLRQALPAADRFLYSDTQTLQWLPDSPFALDVANFERAVAQAHSLESLQAAVNLYGGELLPGCYDDWILPERERLQQAFCAALEQLSRMLEEHGDYHAAILHAEQWLRCDPLCEETYRRLIRLYALSGDRTGAVRVYHTCVRVLKRELGVEPSRETQTLYTELQKLPAARVRLTSPRQQRTSNLPTYLTSFIGREREVAEVKRLLVGWSDGRMVTESNQLPTRLFTLTGSGGCGKTRLAVQVAGDLAGAFADGVWFVDVATLTDPALIPHAIASTLNIPEQMGRELLETIANHLRAKELLLVLDNCEQMVAACARLAESVLRACPRLQILATSREKLNLSGETTWPVPSLSLPDTNDLSRSALARSDAICLFVERACAVLPTFTLDADNAAAVVQICQRLDGLPLAIELAAARVTMLTPTQIAARLDNAFQLLVQTSPSIPLRHRTLRATMDWSYELLSEPERVLLGRLSAFAGRFTLDAAEAVCADPDQAGDISTTEILDLLSRLVDKSLVVVSDWKQGDQLRYRLLQPTWQYATEKALKSDDWEQTRLRHLEFYLHLAEEAEPHFSRTDQVMWFNRLIAEHDNLMAALDWSLKRGELTAALRLTGALEYFWLARGYYSDGLKRLLQAIALTKDAAPSTARAKALWAAGALLLWSEGTWSQARPLLAEALATARTLADKQMIATALNTLGATACGQKDFMTARSFLTESQQLWRALGDRHGLGWSLAYLGDVAFLEHHVEEAQPLYTESIAHFRSIGDINSAGYAIRRLGVSALNRGDYQQASKLFKESLTLNHQVGYPKGIVACLSAEAELAFRQGQQIRAATLIGAAEALLHTVAGTLFPTDQTEYEHTLAALRAQLGAAALDAAWAAGRAMKTDEAMAYALKADEN